MDIDWNILYTLIGAIGGGMMVQLLKIAFPTKRDSIEAGQNIRENLIRVEGELRTEIRQTQQELDSWKDKYYQLLEDYNNMNNAFDKLQKEYQSLQHKHDNLKKEVNKLKGNR